MILLDFLDTNIEPLIVEDRITPDNFCYSYFPLVNNQGELIATIEAEDFFNFNSMSYKIDPQLIVSPILHPLDCVYKINELDTNILFIVDTKGKYLGAISAQSLSRYFSQFTNQNNTIFVAEIPYQRFSLAEIAAIVESEGNKILSFYSRPLASETIELTLVFRDNNLSQIIGVLENKGYKIIQIYNEFGVQNHLQNRYENLMSYLNI